jgi:hypothetical protein
MVQGDAAVTISNNPPPFEAFSLHIEELFSMVSGTTAGAKVETDEQDAALDGLMDDLRKAKKDADAQRDLEKRPHDEAAKAVQAKWRPLLLRCDMGIAEIKALLTPYRDAKQKAKNEAARLAREEAEAKQRAAQEALKASDDLEARFAAEEQLKQAKKLTAVANKIDRSATGLRTTWRAEVTDFKALLRHYLDRRPDEMKAWLAEQADKDVRAGERVIPGVNITEQKVAA